MKRKAFLEKLAIVLLVPFVLAACKDKSPVVASDGKEKTYTCPMHPQIIRNAPGTCPVCGMDLVPFDKSNVDESLTLGSSQQTLANITTMTVGSGAITNFVRLNGRLATNPEATTFVSSRVPGRIETLYVRQTGVPVRKGQPLYRIYSEQLSTLQQEYLLIAAQARSFPDDHRFQQMERAGRQKLLLYGQTEGQVQDLVRNQNTNPYVTYLSPASGVVAELSVTEGNYVSEGGNIMRLEGYGEIWVEADVYPSEAGNVKKGQQVRVVVAGYEDQPQNMTISFLTPALQGSSQTIQVRGTIPNPGNQWQPGQQASILLPAAVKEKTLALPVDAVIREGRGTHVWIEKTKGKYEPRMVTTGTETVDRVEITSGLEEGEMVVVTGAYLLYSEFVLKKGKHPMAGMNH